MIEVVAAIIREGNKIFATQRGYGEWKDWWEFPGGKMEEGETPEEALKREIREELSTEINVDEFLCTVEYDYPKFHLTMHCYLCSLQTEDLHLNEHEAAKWLTMNELDDVKWLPADRLVIDTINKWAMKQRILFVCHGNICRSPMAEFVMKDLVRKAGIEDDFYIESAATSTEEAGNGVYPPAKSKLAEHGISCLGKTARQMTRRDYERFDLLVGMDKWNIRNMRNICGGDPQGKIVMLMDYTSRPGDVADPWYTGDFEATWQDVLEGCQGLLEACIK